MKIFLAFFYQSSTTANEKTMKIWKHKDIYALNLERGWSGGAKVLGKLSLPGRPTSLDDSRARAYCACSRCGRGLFGHFFSPLSFLFSFSLSLGDGPI